MKRINALEFDTLLDVQRDFFPIAYTLGRKLKIERKIGYNFAGKSKPYTDPISKKREEHLLHFYALGIRVLDSGFNLRTLPKTLDQTKELAFIFNFSASIDGEVWAEENWLQLIQHLTLKTFNKYILFKGDLPEKLQVELERNSTVFLIDSVDEKIKNSILITLVNDIYFESILNKQMALLLDNKSERRKLRRPIVEGSICVTPRFQGDGIKNIQFDTVLKAVREILYEVIE